MNKLFMKQLIMLIILIPISVFGQGLTLKEAETLAIRNNYQLLISQKNVDLSVQNFRNAVGAVLPTISAYGQYTNNVELPVFLIDFDGPGPGEAQALPMGAKISSTMGISLSQPLFTGGAVLAGYNIAKEGIRLSEFQLKIEEDNTIFTVRMFWYQIQLTNSLLEAVEQGLTSSKANLELAEKKLAAGTANQFEILQARVNYEGLKPKQIALKNQLKILESNLLTYLNDKNINSVHIKETLIQEVNEFENKSLEELQTLALTHRLELGLLESQKVILKNQKNIAYAMALPMLSLSADLRKQAQSDSRDNLDYYQSKNVSFNMSVPLFQGGRKLADIQKSKISIKQAELQKALTETMICAEVESWYLKVNESNQSIEANVYLVSQAKEALRLAKLMYTNGTVTQLEVLNAESAVLQAQSAYYSSIFDYNISLNQLKKAIHKL